MKTDDLVFIDNVTAALAQNTLPSAEATVRLLRIIFELQTELGDSEEYLDDMTIQRDSQIMRAEQAEAERDAIQEKYDALNLEFKAACESANDLQLFVEDSQPKLAQVTAERDALAAWKAAVPLLEIDIVCTDQLVKNEWEGRCAIIEEWLDVVRTRFEYLSDADRRKVLASLDGAA